MKKYLNINGKAMAVINRFVPILFFVLALSCSSKDDNAIELRFYSVLNYPGDSIWVDTLSSNSNVKLKGQSTSTLIHSIDSVLSKSLDSTRFRNIQLKPKSKVFVKGAELMKYYAGVEFELGVISYYGIYLKDFGTVYLRWLDGHKALMINKTIRNNKETDFSQLAFQLDSLIYSQMNIDSIHINTEYGIDDSFDLKIDTTLIKLK